MHKYRERRGIIPALSSEKPRWLERYLEHKRLEETVKLFKYNAIPSVEEFIQHVGRVYKSVKKTRRGFRGRLDLELRRLEAVYRETISYLKRISKLPLPQEMSSFHRLLVESFVGDSYEKAVRKARRAIKLVKRIYGDYRILLLASRNSREASKYRREGSGRMLSVVRRLSKNIEVIRSVRAEIVKTHVVSEGLPVVVVAGPPNAGKSTLVKRISTAKPEIASYPFTTKTIIVGKASYNSTWFYVIDTPGILEQDPARLSTIERKALITILSLADILLYLIDPVSSLASVKEQARLLSRILSEPGEHRIVVRVAVNKADLLSSKELEKVLEEAKTSLESEGVNLEPHAISAEKGYGLDKLLKDIAKVASKITST